VGAYTDLLQRHKAKHKIILGAEYKARKIKNLHFIEKFEIMTTDKK